MTKLNHKFVEFIPDTLEAGVLYVSIAHGTAVHSCCCGCGNEVVTPLTPTDWKMIYDGDTVSLHPSIGNCNFPCRSHYWIKHNRVEWAEDWPDRRGVSAGVKNSNLETGGSNDIDAERKKPHGGFWSRFWRSW